MGKAFRPCLIMLMAAALASCSADGELLPEQEQPAGQPSLKRPAQTDTIDVSGGDIPIDDGDDDSTATTGIVLPTV